MALVVALTISMAMAVEQDSSVRGTFAEVKNKQVLELKDQGLVELSVERTEEPDEPIDDELMEDPESDRTGLCKTISNKNCIFPFKYKGIKYTDCTTAGHYTKWCATEVDGYDMEMVFNQWGACGSNCNKDTPCFSVALTTKSYGSEISWSVGSCTSRETYTNNAFSRQDCCAPTGSTITCTDSYGDGWHGGYLEINDQRYCENFATGKEQTMFLGSGTGTCRLHRDCPANLPKCSSHRKGFKGTCSVGTRCTLSQDCPRSHDTCTGGICGA